MGTYRSSVVEHLRSRMLAIRSALIVVVHSLSTVGAPVLACVSKGVPGIFMDCHMMVAQPEKVCVPSKLRPFDMLNHN